jgi:malonate transporter
MMSIFNNLVPVFALMAVGHFMGRIKFVEKGFFTSADRVVYFIFFPVMLFWKIGGTDSAESINWALTSTVLGLLTGAWLLSLVYAKFTKMPANQVGAFSQCCYRFNTYVGLAVILSALGEDGVTEFGILISVVIPYLNVLAVSTLIWFSQEEYSGKQKFILLFKAMLANPLIIGCLAGLAYSLFKTPFPAFFDNTFRLLSVAALPLALLSIGNSLNFDMVKGYLKPALAATVIRQAVLPLVGYFVLSALVLDDMPFKTAMLFLAMPTSTTAYILSGQLGSDPRLASACIVMSTVLSFFSMSAVIVI